MESNYDHASKMAKVYEAQIISDSKEVLAAAWMILPIITAEN